MGHGKPTSGHALLEWQATYINRFLDVLRSEVDDGLQGEVLEDAVATQMKAYLPNEDLLFLARLSVAPLRDQFLASGR